MSLRNLFSFSSIFMKSIKYAWNCEGPHGKKLVLRSIQKVMWLKTWWMPGNVLQFTVRKCNNLTTSITLLDELPSMTTIVFPNKRQWCYATWLFAMYWMETFWNLHHGNIVKYVTSLSSNYASSLWFLIFFNFVQKK